MNQPNRIAALLMTMLIMLALASGLEAAIEPKRSAGPMNFPANWLPWPEPEITWLTTENTST